MVTQAAVLIKAQGRKRIVETIAAVQGLDQERFVLKNLPA